MPYSNQNLAGILSVALGLESAEGRNDFSGSHRQTLRSALDDTSEPANFRQLLEVLERAAAGDKMLEAVRRFAQHEPERDLQDFAASFAKGD